MTSASRTNALRPKPPPPPLYSHISKRQSSLRRSCGFPDTAFLAAFFGGSCCQHLWRCWRHLMICLVRYSVKTGSSNLVVFTGGTDSLTTCFRAWWSVFCLSHHIITQARRAPGEKREKRSVRAAKANTSLGHDLGGVVCQTAF